jgi:hypothetical protein
MPGIFATDATGATDSAGNGLQISESEGREPLYSMQGTGDVRDLYRNTVVGGC